MKSSIIGRVRSTVSIAEAIAAVVLLSSAVRAEDPPKPAVPSKLPIPGKATSAAGAISKLPGIPGFGKSKPATETGTATKLPATPAKVPATEQEKGTVNPGKPTVGGDSKPPTPGTTQTGGGRGQGTTGRNETPRSEAHTSE